MATPEKRTRLLILAAALLAVAALFIIIILQSMDKGVPMAPGPFPLGDTPTPSSTVVV